MFRVIAVDDEKKALNRFEQVMKDEARVSIIGKFTRGEDAVEFVRQNQVDIAFLDIEMPGMSGLELAERLSEKNPLIEIVFITAYDQYALKAFQAHAIGYLLKPLDTDEIKEQIDRLDQKLRHRQQRNQAGFLTIRCFGHFSCCTEDGETAPIRFRTAKAEELFALLIHYRGMPISREVIIDALWPESEPEKAANNFRVTCTYLRNTFADRGFPDILLRERDSYLINTAYLSCDLFQFTSAAEALSVNDPSALAKTAALYTGAYFENKPYEWAGRTSVWLENEFKKMQYALADEFLRREEHKNACEALEKVIDHDPYEEEAVERLVLLKLQAGNHTSAARIYREYEQRLLKDLGLSPSEKLRALCADR